jgi:pullulanase/glycogen debranching enzyme
MHPNDRAGVRVGSDISWFDWTYPEPNREIYRFTCGMIAFRRAHPVLSEERFCTDAEIQWLGRAGRSPDWFDPKEKAAVDHSKLSRPKARSSAIFLVRKQVAS